MLFALPFPSIYVAANERVEAANAPAKHLFGEAIVGRHFITVMRHPPLLEAIEKVFKSGEVAEALFLTTQAKRDTSWKVTAAPLNLDEASRPTKTGVIVSFEDQTDLREAGQMRRDFVANVSHELRTPLTALLGFIETLKGAAKNDADARDRFLGIMEKEATRMNRLVGDLLSLGRVEAEERVRPMDPVDLDAVLQSVLITLRPMAAESHVEILSYATLDNGPAVVPGDADQIAQIATNLIENAIKYSGKGREIKIDLRHDPSNPMVRGSAWIFSVADTGEGISHLHIPRLTERFYRVDSHRSRELGGTGLGLAIVKHIVNRHRGRLNIESKPGEGSRFSVILAET